MGRKRYLHPRRRLTITVKALAQAKDVAFRHSPACKGVQLPNALSKMSGTVLKKETREVSLPDKSMESGQEKSKRKEQSRSTVGFGPTRRLAEQLCSICHLYFHTSRIAGHLQEAHGITEPRVAKPASPVTPRPRPVVPKSTIQYIQQKMAEALRATDPVAQAGKTRNEVEPRSRDWTDGQPKFEGGLHWVQGGSPGLGKKR